MQLSDSKGYVFALVVESEAEVALAAGEVSVEMMVSSPRSAFLMPPRAVDRYEVMTFIIHLDAMLDGLVESYDIDSDEGWVEFPRMLLSIRHVHAPDGLVGFEVSVHDCGCEDERDFNHGGFILLMVEPSTLERELIALDTDLRAAGQAAGRSSPATRGL